MFTQAFLLGAFAASSYAQAFSSSLSFAGSSSSSTTAASPVAAQTTMSLFIDASDDQGFVGSVVSADSCETTYALYCTEGDYGSGLLSRTCDPNASGRATYGPGFFGLYTEIETAGARATLSESCSLDGTTQAICTASIHLSAEGHQTKTQTAYTRSGDDVNYYQVPITGGASKLNGLATCTNSGNAAPAATGAVDLVKVLVVPGAAALLAGFNAMA